jgi:hypothetical protein
MGRAGTGDSHRADPSLAVQQTFPLSFWLQKLAVNASIDESVHIFIPAVRATFLEHVVAPVHWATSTNAHVSIEKPM